MTAARTGAALLLLVAMFPGALSIIYNIEKTIASGDHAYVVGEFVFKSGGTLSFTPLGLTGTSSAFVYFAAMNASSLKRVSSFSCLFANDSAADSLAYYHYTSDDEGATRNWTVPRYGKIYLLWVGCSSSKLHMKFEIVAMNPGGEHLSADVVPIRTISIVFVALWAAILLAWLANCAWNYDQRPRLPYASGIYIILKLIVISLLCGYYQWVHTHGTVTSAFMTAYYIFLGLEGVGFLVLLLLIASGWGIVDQGWIPRHPWPIVSIAIALFLSTELFHFVSSSFSIARAIFLFVMVLMVPFRINTTCDILDAQIMAFSISQHQNAEVDGVPQTVRLTKKAAMLDKYRYIIIGFAVGMLAVDCSIMFDASSWISQLLYEMLDYITLVVIAWTYRVRTEKRQGYYFLEEDGSELTEVSRINSLNQPV